MMTLDECRRHVGKPVVYRPPHGARDEDGVISSVGDLWVYVRYGGAAYGKATDPALLILTRDLIDAQTGGLHPAEVCGDDCAGCCTGNELGE